MISQRKKKIRLIAIAIFIMGLVFSSWRVILATRLDNLDVRLIELAGSKAIDCGVVEPNEGEDYSNRKAVNACVATNLKTKRPFFARYNGRRNSSGQQESSGFVQTPDGKARFLWFNINACGGKQWTSDVMIYKCDQPYFHKISSDIEQIACKDDWCK